MGLVARGNPFRRLWHPRAILRLAVPLAVIILITLADKSLPTLLKNVNLVTWRDVIHYALVFIAALLALFTVRMFTGMLGEALQDHLGIGRARSLATLVSVILYGVVIILSIGGIGNLNGLLLGGALTGVVVGIAAQASLSNIIAGLVILFARPYSAGMFLTARTGSFGGVEYSGQVWDISLFYTTFHSAGQEIRIPNSVMITAVVVTRPQSLDVYIPVTLPRSADVPATLDKLRRSIASATAERRAPRVTLDSITEVGSIISVRVFVAGETERRAVERVVAGIAMAPPELPDLAQASQPTPTPTPDQAPPIPMLIPDQAPPSGDSTSGTADDTLVARQSDSLGTPAKDDGAGGAVPHQS